MTRGYHLKFSKALQVPAYMPAQILIGDTVIDIADIAEVKWTPSWGTLRLFDGIEYTIGDGSYYGDEKHVDHLLTDLRFLYAVLMNCVLDCTGPDWRDGFDQDGLDAFRSRCDSRALAPITPEDREEYQQERRRQCSAE